MLERLHRLGLLTLLLLLVGCEPLAWLVSAPTLTTEELSARLESTQRPAMLDLRSRNEYTHGHIAGSVHTGLGDVGAAIRALPSGCDVVLICEHGRLAALAVPYVRGADHDRVSVLAGGVARWRARGFRLVDDPGTQVAQHGPRRLALTRWEALLTYGSGVVVKPAYMLLSLALILWLWRSRDPGLVMLRRGLWAFMIGETACLFGYYWSPVDALFQPLESLHGLGMAIGIALGFWSSFLIVDGRMLGILDPSHACSLTKFCGKCHKRSDVPCQPKRLMRALLLLVLPLGAMPWCKALLVHDISTTVFGWVVDYRWPIVNQILELRLYPLLGVVLLSTAWLTWNKPVAYSRRGEGALFLGLGFLGFSLLRVLLTGAFDETPYWGEIWEELTELTGIAGVAVTLWVFRSQFGLPWRPRSAEFSPSTEVVPHASRD